MPAPAPVAPAKVRPADSLKHVSTTRGRKHALYPAAPRAALTHGCRRAETAQFRAVMGHAIYRQDPLGILQQHLTNTVKLHQKELQERE